MTHSTLYNCKNDNHMTTTSSNKKAVRYGARNHSTMPLLHIPPSSFAQNLEMFP